MSLTSVQNNPHFYFLTPSINIAWGGGGRTVSLGLVDTNYTTFRMDKQRGPTVQHRELLPVSSERPGWKRTEDKEPKRVHMCTTDVFA